MRLLAALGIAVLALMFVGAATAGSDSRRPTAPPATAVVSVEHVQQHAWMTEQMRASIHSGHMVNPMWADMRTTGWIQAEERYQADVDRMLAR